MQIEDVDDVSNSAYCPLDGMRSPKTRRRTAYEQNTLLDRINKLRHKNYRHKENSQTVIYQKKLFMTLPPQGGSEDSDSSNLIVDTDGAKMKK